MAIILPPNSTGTTVDTNTVSAKDREVVNIGDPSAANTAAVQASSPARAAQRLSVGATPTNIVDPALSVANLGISGVFTGAWFAVGDGGDSFIDVAARADVASATDGFQIQESDATADANFTRVVAQITAVAATTTFLRVQIRAANWRVVYTNGGTGQASFRLAYRTSPVPLLAFDDFHTGASIVPVELAGIALPGASGPVVGGTATNPLRSDPTGTTTQPVSAASLPLPAGAATSALQLAAGHAVAATLSAETTKVIGTVRAQGNLGAAFDAATDAPVPANALLSGLRAQANEPTAVSTDGDIVAPWADLLGRQVVLLGHANPEAPVTVNGSAAGVSVIATPGASLSLYICKGTVHNRAATETVVSLRDGAAGTIHWTADLAVDGGGSMFDFGSRGWKLTANTALVADIGQASVDVNITEYYIAA